VSVDWLRFSPASSFTGGILIGSAACCLILFVGRIAGISGILGGLLRPMSDKVGWRVAFLAGLVAAPLLYRLFAALPDSRIDSGWVAFASGATGRYRDALWFGMHQRTRRVRVVPLVAPFVRRGVLLHGGGISNRFRDPPSVEAAMILLVSFATGLIFGIGLIVGGMTDPAKVLGFLDLAGGWAAVLILIFPQ
jgi:hypothetical protein